MYALKKATASMSFPAGCNMRQAPSETRNETNHHTPPMVPGRRQQKGWIALVKMIGVSMQEW